MRNVSCGPSCLPSRLRAIDPTITSDTYIWGAEDSAPMPPKIGIFAGKYERSELSFFRRGLRCFPPRCWTEALFGDGALERAVSKRSKSGGATQDKSKRARDLR